jgi:hypothetical protein
VNLPCTTAAFTLSPEPQELCCVVPTRPETGPYHAIPSVRTYASGFGLKPLLLASDHSSRNRPCLRLVLLVASGYGHPWFLSQSHKTLDKLRQKAMMMTENVAPDPALNFLAAIDNKFKLERMNQEVQAIGVDASALLRHASEIGRRLYENKDRFPSPAPSMFNIITCRQDGTSLRFPEQSGDLIATCPTCKYRFPYNTSSLAFSVPLVPRIRGSIARFLRRSKKRLTREGDDRT